VDTLLRVGFQGDEGAHREIEEEEEGAREKGREGDCERTWEGGTEAGRKRKYF